MIDNLDCDAVELVERRLPSELPSRLLITSQRPLPGSRSELEPLPLEVATDFLSDARAIRTPPWRAPWGVTGSKYWTVGRA